MNRSICSIALATVITTTGYAQPGTLDPDFGTGGIVTGNFGSAATSRVNAMVVQPDGKIVVVGQLDYTNDRGLLIARYNTNGSLDNTFDNNGWDTIKFDAGYARASAVALQADGKIVVAGSSMVTGGGGGAIARFNPDGSLDMTFDSDGKVSQLPGDCNSVVIQADGKIVVAGDYNLTDGVIMRFNANGSPDMNFHSGTAFYVYFNGSANIEDVLTSVAVQPDGKIVAAGWGTDAFYNSKFGLVRLKADGSSYDSSFAQDGMIWTTGWGDREAFHAMTLQPDGKIVAGGRAVKAGTMAMTLVRFNTDGTMDNSFGTGGIAQAFTSSSYTLMQAISLQSDGRIIAAGTHPSGGSDEFALARFNTDGSLDTSFDADGMVITPVGPGNDGVYATAIQADGKLLAGGWAAGSYNYIVARYLDSAYVDAVEVVENVAPAVYPNPGDGLFVLETVEAGLPYIVADVSGRIVLSGTTTKGQTKIDLRKYADGVYLLRIENGVVRLVKE